MKRLYICVIFFIKTIVITSSLLYSRDIICVLPFVLNESLSDQYVAESLLTNESININEVKSIFDKYEARDGIPRLLVDELNKSKRFLALDYDMMVALLYEADMDNSYTSFSTNTQKASEIFERIISARYVISGEIIKFDSVFNKDMSTEISEAEIRVNLIEVKTNKIITSIVEKSSIESLYRGQIYLTHDAYFLETALGKATEVVLGTIVNKIIDELNYPILEASIVRVEEDVFYINIGRKLNVKTNDIFDIYKSTFIFSGTNNDKYKDIVSNNNRYSIIGNISNTINEAPTSITNKEGEVRYTSGMLRDYLKSIIINEYVGKARAIEVYENYSKMKVYSVDEAKNNDQNGKNNFHPELLMKAIFYKNDDDNEED